LHAEAVEDVADLVGCSVVARLETLL